MIAATLKIRLGIFALAGMGLWTTPVMAQGAMERGAFVTMLGRDTAAVERFTRSSSQLKGEVVEVFPRVIHTNYTLQFGPDGAPTDYLAEVHVGVDTAVAIRTQLTFGKDSIRFTRVQGTNTRYLAAPAEPGVVPENLYYWALYENETRAMARTKSDSMVFRVVSAGGPKPYDKTFRHGTGDTLSTIWFYPEYWTNYLVDGSGRLLGIDAAHTTVKVQVKRYPTVPLETFLTAAVAKEQQTGRMGAMSTADSSTTKFGDADVSVVYSRPAARGRKIWGEVVPFGTVWRTGANSATRIHLSAPMEINGKMIPAGHYTLYSLPTANGASLIINKQVGQWGTEYNADSDLVRIPVKTERLTTPVERFTIRFGEANGPARDMIVEWDDMRWTVPVRKSGQ